MKFMLIVLLIRAVVVAISKNTNENKTMDECIRNDVRHPAETALR